MVFIKGCMRLPLGWKLWLLTMGMTNGVGPLFFLSEATAIVTIAAMLSASVLGMVMAQAYGFTKILGLMHLPWVPMVTLQGIEIFQNDLSGAFEIWLISSFTVSCSSLLIDTLDVWKFFKS